MFTRMSEKGKTDNCYVYELSSSENKFIPFYVGKGKGNRINTSGCPVRKGTNFRSNKNQKILEIIHNGFTVCSRKIFDGLSEDDAFRMEKDVVIAYRKEGYVLCNMNDGGRFNENQIIPDDRRSAQSSTMKYCMSRNGYRCRKLHYLTLSYDWFIVKP